MPFNFKDLTGQGFGKWTVLKRDVTKTTTNVYWWCCCQCGTEKSVMGMSLKNGRSTQCRLCWERGHKHNLNARVWGRILRGAKLRGISVELGDKNDAKQFLYDLLHRKQQGRCALSGLPISIANTIRGDMSRGETTASLDRIDSSKGYTRDNVQWVHKDINKMKMDLSQNAFIALCKAVATNHADGSIL